VRSTNAELQERIRNLEQWNRSLTDQLESVQSDLAAAERENRELTALIRTKDARIASQEFEFEKLEDDYRRLMDIRTADKEALMARQLEITRLQLEIDQIRPTDQNRRYRSSIVEGPMTSYRPQFEAPRASAFRDPFALDFEDRPRGLEDVPLNELSEGDLRSRLEELVRGKAENERKLNLAAPPGMKLTQIRQQKQELEDEVVRLAGIISKIRLEMRRRQYL
jgi:hypothetical protein